ncbi:MAG: DUF11 domain-containing protein, partial [Acidobacteria bacterium]
SAGDQTPIPSGPGGTAPDLAISKDDGGATARAGDVVSYTVSYSNLGNQDATGVVITDVVPAGATFDAAASSPGWTCAPDAGPGSTCTLTIASLAGGGGNGTATFAVRVDDPLAAGVGEIANTATIADDGQSGGDLDPSNNSAGDQTPIPSGPGGTAPDLAISKDDGGVSARAGDVVSYTVSYSNLGNQDATGVVITDVVPAGTTFDAASSSPEWSCVPAVTPGSTCTTTVLNLAAGGSGSATFAVRVDDPIPSGQTSVVNTATISDSGGRADLDPANNSATDVTPLIDDHMPETLDVSLTKDDAGITVAPGGAAIYTLTYANLGSAPAPDVLLTETVPAHTRFLAAISTPGWLCAGDGPGSLCSLTLGDLAPGATGTATFTVELDADVPDNVTHVNNQARIDPDAADDDPSNNQATDSTPIRRAPPATGDLAVIKTADRETYQPGDAITYAIEWSYHGPTPLTDVIVSDVLPPGVEPDLAASDPRWGCLDGTCVIVLPTLDPGATGRAELTVTTAGAHGDLLNSALIEDLDLDETDAANNAAAVLTTQGDPDVVDVPTLNHVGLGVLLLGLLVFALRRLRHAHGGPPATH